MTSDTAALLGSSRAKDLAGKRFGRWTVTDFAGFTAGRCARWAARCECGTEKVVSSARLLSGKSKSCGCLARELTRKRQFQDLTGLRFGRLLVVGLSSKKHPKYRYNFWDVVCDCGARKTLNSSYLKIGTRSCGCLQRELARARRTNPRLSDADRVRKRKRPTSAGLDSPTHEELSRKAMARDNYVCRACGTRGGDLAAHHILAWKTHEARRYDLSNLVTLCRGCHKEFHTRYGYSGFSPEDFNEFLEMNKERRNER